MAAVVLLIGAGSFLLVLLRLAPSLQATGRLIQFASFIPFGIAGWVVVLGWALRRIVRNASGSRRFAVGVAALATALLMLQVAWLVPRYVSRSVGDGVDMTVLTQNLQIGQAAGPALMQRAATADVVILVEVTPDALRRLDDAGMRDRFPYGVGTAGWGADGTYVYSRWPLTDLRIKPEATFNQVFTQVAVPGFGPVTVVGVHPVNPMYWAPGWMRDARALGAAAQNLPRDIPLVMAGDFNATPDHRSLRTLMRLSGLHLASDDAGAGYLPTWPVNLSIVPTVLPIDHVLVRGAVMGRSVTSYSLPDSDHRGLIATLRLTHP